MVFLYIVLIILGFALLIKGADFLVDGSTKVAKKFRIPEMIIGLTIVAMGTSMPELVVSFTSAMEGYSDLSLGNVVGSNLVNLLFILGICAVIKNVAIKEETKKFEIPVNIIVTVVLLLLCNFGMQQAGISRIEGLILLGLFAIYICYLILKAKKERVEEENTSTEDISIVKSIVAIVIGIVGLKFGADFVIDNSVKIAEMIGISEKIIGLTIVAVGTSLPELVASVTALIKGEEDLAIGNVLGSNIFNILLILGVSSLISPIVYNLTYNFDIILLLISTLLLLAYAFIGKKNEITRLKGAIFAVIYIIYVIVLICA